MATEGQKRYALRLLMTPDVGTEEDLDLVVELLAPEQTPKIQSYAVSALERRGDSAAIKRLLTDLDTRAPERQAGVLESLFRLPGGSVKLLEKIERGELPATLLDARKQQRLRSASDPQVAARAKKLFAAAPDADRGRVLKAHEHIAGLDGDPRRGKLLFDKQCAACHQLAGVGHAIGSNLATLRDRTPESLLVAILDPNRAVEPRYLEYQIETLEGRLFTGLILSESEAYVVLGTADGKQHTIPRQQIGELRTNGRSLMPEGLEKELSPQQLADVIAFVATGGNLVTHNPPDSG
jgi:putative heme-binding domain-containing protein